MQPLPVRRQQSKRVLENLYTNDELQCVTASAYDGRVFVCAAAVAGAKTAFGVMLNMGADEQGVLELLPLEPAQLPKAGDSNESDVPVPVVQAVHEILGVLINGPDAGKDWRRALLELLPTPDEAARAAGKGARGEKGRKGDPGWKGQPELGRTGSRRKWWS